uniref:Peptidase S1 domain-containing protein n=1 Tax=Steinernema glaseri TaxID=37863 RepID=A0A1I8AGU0_9BILA
MKLHMLLLLLGAALCQAGRLTPAENADRLRTCGAPLPVDPFEELDLDAHLNQFKVVNGRNSGPRPYAAQLIYSLGGYSGSELCGGTLISSRHVLTAAHCVFENMERFCEGSLYSVRRNASNWKIVLKSRCGEMRSNEDCEAQDSKIYAKPTKIFVNRRFYTSKCSEGDIAIMELDRDYVLEEEVTPACVAGQFTRFHQYNSNKLTAFGWGFDPNLDLRTTGGFHGLLQEVNLKVQHCGNAHITDHICTEEVQYNVCRGQIFTDVRVYNAFICKATGICPPPHLMRMTKQRRTVLEEYVLE